MGVSEVADRRRLLQTRSDRLRAGRQETKQTAASKAPARGICRQMVSGGPFSDTTSRSDAPEPLMEGQVGSPKGRAHNTVAGTCPQVHTGHCDCSQTSGGYWIMAPRRCQYHHLKVITVVAGVGGAVEVALAESVSPRALQTLPSGPSGVPGT